MGFSSPGVGRSPIRPLLPFVERQSGLEQNRSESREQKCFLNRDSPAKRAATKNRQKLPLAQ